ncbi:MAG: EF-P beta-lysylation protein EpmB [Wenzhouxiangellaceae bacterium]
MITAAGVSDIGDWRQEMQRAWRDPRALLAHLGHDPDEFALAGTGFAFLVTRDFAARMRHGDRNDPLLRQVLPLAEENLRRPGFGSDPVGDQASRATPGLLHKYQGRALVIATGACPIHCRYCFRREFDYREEMLDTRRAGQIAEWLDRHPEIDELILSGGDPLMLSNARLKRLVQALTGRRRIRRLRIHSRVPVTLPGRIDDELLRWLGALNQRVVVVIHANHANEFDASVAAALGQLRRAGADVLNQAVLLAGVNDCVEALAGLMQGSHDAGALPYYLHLLDRVEGSAHFEVPEARASELIEQLRARLPGYLVPRLVREQAGEPSKTPVA